MAVGEWLRSGEPLELGVEPVGRRLPHDEVQVGEAGDAVPDVARIGEAAKEIEDARADADPVA